MSYEINIKTKSKKTKLIIILFALVIVLLAAAAVFFALSKNAAANKVEKQLSLGEKYLSELDYEQAIAAYELAIEIDPKNADAYIGLAEVYEAMGEYEKAEEILEDATDVIKKGEDLRRIEEQQEQVEAKKVEGTKEPEKTPDTNVKTELTPMPTQGTTSEPKPESTPILIPEPTEDPAPTLSPEPTGILNPELTQMPTPELTEEPAEEPTEEPIEEPTEEPVLTPGSTPVPTPELTEEPTPGPTPTLSPEPTETPIPMPTATPSPEPTETLIPMPTATPSPKPTATPTPEPTKEPVKEEEKAVNETLNLGSDGFTYTELDGKCLCTGLSAKGYEQFEKYNEKSYITILLPATSDKGVTVEGFYSNSTDGFDLQSMLTKTSASVELICPETYTVYYGLGNETLKDAGRDKLKKVVLNEGVEIIKAGAFIHCTGLEQVVIPESVIEIGKDAFYGCKKLVIDNLDMTGRTFGVRPFMDVTIKKLTLGGSATVDSVTWSGSKVETIEIKDGMKELPKNAFANCALITEITIPSGIETIGNGVFMHCTGLEQVVIPESVISIGKDAFYGCKKLVIDNLDMTGRTFGVRPFMDVTIKKLTLGGSATVDSVTWAGAKVEAIEIKGGTKELPKNAFANCNLIIKVTIPSGVETIGNSTFMHCTGLEQIIIPESVVKIGNSVFYGCESLSIVTKSGTAAEAYAQQEGIGVQYQ